MVKKILGFVLVAILSVTTALAGEDRVIKFESLPAKARQFTQNYFKGQSISIVTMERDFFSKSYEIIFTTGDRVEFDKSGLWTEVECHTAIPQGIVPVRVRASLNRDYPSLTVYKIERKTRKRFEVHLSNGLELTFSEAGQLVEVD